MAVNPPRALIAEAVNVVIHIAGRGRKRRIESIARVVGFDGVGYQLADAMETPFPRCRRSPMPRLLRRLPCPLTNLENCHDADDHSCFPFFCKSGFAPCTATLPGPSCGQGLLLAALLLFGPEPRRRPVPQCRGKACNPSSNLQGPVARIVAVIIIIATGLALAFGDTSGGFRKLIQIVFGLSIAFAASSFFLSFQLLRRAVV